MSGVNNHARHTRSVLIADDHMAIRKGLRSLIDGHDSLKVIAEAADGEEAVEKTEELRPNVVVLDLTMPNLDGIAAAEQIRKIAPETLIVIFSMHAFKEVVERAKEAGARAFVSKFQDANELLAAIDAVLHNRSYFPSLTTSN